MDREASKMKKALAILAVSGLAVAASADVLVINIGGWTADGGYQSGLNTTADFNLGVGTTIDDASFDVTWTAPSPSWRSELVLSLNDDLFGAFWDTVPSVTDSSGSETQAANFAGSLGGFIGGPFTLTSGILHVEIYDLFNDAGIDQRIDTGVITVHYTPVPAPGAMALLGVAGLVARRRR
jgi:uncharacterized protein (TIGR03382 family)